MPNHWPKKTSQLHQSIKHLLPPGFAFPRDNKTNLQAVMKAIAAVNADFINHADSALLHSIPSELCCDDLADWQNTVGLPDDCLGELDNCDQQKAAIISRLAGYALKYTDSSTASLGFLKDLAEAVGHEIDIWASRPFRSGHNNVGDKLGENGTLNIRVYGVEYGATVCEPMHVGEGVGQRLQECSTTTKITNPLITCSPFRAGKSNVGERLGNGCKAKILECLFNRIAPARYQLNFIYY